MEITDVQSAINAGKEIMTGKEIVRTEKGSFFLVPENTKIESVSMKNMAPNRATGVRDFVSAKSFCSYVNKHKIEDQTIIIADEKGVIKAIFNDNGEKPQWGDFGAELTLYKSRQWKNWIGMAGNLYSQEEFAQIIEENRSDFMSGKVEDTDGNIISDLNPNEFSKMILNLEQTITESLTSKIDPVSGARKFSYSNDEVGDGSFKMPKQMVIGIPVFKNGDLFQIIVSLRSRIENKTARFGFIINGIDETIDKAFGKVCSRIFHGQNKDSDKCDASEEFEGTHVEVYMGNI